MFKELELLTLANLEEIERKVELFHIPNSVERLPINIASNYLKQLSGRVGLTFIPLLF